MRIEAPVWDARLQRGDHNAFDIVRLVLATFVLLEHSFFLIYGAADQDPLSRLSGGRTNLGQFAVYTFFAISGFLVTYSLQQSDGIFQFLVKRVGRIVPGFLVASAVGCLVVGPLTATDIGTYFETQNWKSMFVSAIALKQISVSVCFRKISFRWSTGHFGRSSTNLTAIFFWRYMDLWGCFARRLGRYFISYSR